MKGETFLPCPGCGKPMRLVFAEDREATRVVNGVRETALIVRLDHECER